MYNAGNYLQTFTPIDFGAAGLTKSGGSVRLYSPLTGSGTITLMSGGLELTGNNSNFTGLIVANNGTGVVRLGGAIQRADIELFNALFSFREFGLGLALIAGRFERAVIFGAEMLFEMLRPAPPGNRSR